MILKNAKIYAEGFIRNGSLFIQNGIIEEIIYNPSYESFKKLKNQNKQEQEIDCENKLLIPGIIDIHSHLRDMDQSEKETFKTGTQAAAYSGITTVFNMPNTIPPSNTAKNVKNWMEKAKGNIYVNVGFIAGIPKDINEEEIAKILDLGVLGFKIYSLEKSEEIDWTDNLNIQRLLKISSKYQTRIFIHSDYPLSNDLKTKINNNFSKKKYNELEYHNKIHSNEMEAKYIKLIIDHYDKTVLNNNLNQSQYPIIHFCHISGKESYLIIKKALEQNPHLKISFEVTPHHLILNNKIKLKNHNYAKVLPPLRDEEHPIFLFNELQKGNIELIGTDHAPHTLLEKSKDFLDAPNGFPGFETYPLVLLNKVFSYELSLEQFVKVASENPSKIFNLKNKGYIREGYDADLILIDKVAPYPIDSQNFRTKAKFSPFENCKTSTQIVKVFLKGNEISLESSKILGEILHL